jgi:hypothetical protein
VQDKLNGTDFEDRAETGEPVDVVSPSTTVNSPSNFRWRIGVNLILGNVPSGSTVNIKRKD